MLEQGVNVRVTSNSWVVTQASRALDAAVRDLGESCGIVSVLEWQLGARQRREPLLLFRARGQPYAVVVAATNTADGLWSRSHWGAATVDIGAPGGGILSTVPFARSRDLPDIVDDGANLFYEGFGAEDGVDARACTVQAVSADGSTVPFASADDGDARRSPRARPASPRRSTSRSRSATATACTS